MTLFLHEIRQGRKSFVIWTGVIAFLLAVCIFLYPEMKAEMGSISELFASMGSFTAAFGMDRINFGTLNGYYAVECGNVLGLGGAFFAALCAIEVLSKEERMQTSEFLLTHPVSRVKVMTEKLISVICRVVAMNIAIFVIVVASIAVIGEPVPWGDMILMHIAYLLMTLEISCICFGISAFIRKGSLGIGLGIAAILYFLNLIANITESAEFLKYITPFGYCDGSKIIDDGSLDPAKILIGLAIDAVCVAAAYITYPKKDIH